MHAEQNQTISDEELITRWKARVCKVALSITRNYRLNPEDAEDIVSTCQLKLIQTAPDVRHNTNYILRVIDNAARTALLKLRASGGTGTGAESCRTMDYSTAAPRIDTTEPEDDVSAVDRLTPVESREDETVTRLALHAAVAKLSADDQELIRLSYFSDLTPAAIGNLLGVSGQTVRNRLTHIKKLLKNYF